MAIPRYNEMYVDLLNILAAMEIKTSPPQNSM